MDTYLAIDIGASSGRHILGKFEKGKLSIEEIYRFENNIKRENQDTVWDIFSLSEEVIKGLEVCKKKGYTPKSVAIDTWGVDYVLIDKDGKEILPCHAYRDTRTDNIPHSTIFPFTPAELYSKTGIQTQNFNTIYQLFCDIKSGKIKNAKKILMMPDYLSYKLTGVFSNEYTNLSTTGLLNANEKTFDKEICEKVGIDTSLFSEIYLPGSPIGNLKEEIKERVGFDTTVIYAPSHDTASAVAACPLGKNDVYISSGTWSLIGIENDSPILCEKSQKANFTNEGGIEYRFRYLKNIMGMWLFQNIRRHTGSKYTYDEMMYLAKESNYAKTFDPSDQSLNAPENMPEAIRKLLGENDLPLPDLLKSVYISLANSYKKAICEIEELTGKTVDNIIILGGGSKDKYLNELTAKTTGKKVLTGLLEATSIGNLVSQIIYDKKINLTQAREIIRYSFDIKEDK